MIIRALANDVITTTYKGIGHSLCICLDLFGVHTIFLIKQLAKGNGLCSNDMFKGPTLRTGKYGHIEQMTHHSNISLWIFYSKGIFEIFPHKDKATPRPTQSFMRR